LKLFCAALLAMLSVSLVLGQSDRGTITGTVIDSTGAAVPGASVTVTNTATNANSAAVTTSDGVYSIPALQPGVYRVRVEKSGFKRSEIAQVTVAVGGTIAANVTMEVGQVSETVEIASAAGGQVQTEN